MCLNCGPLVCPQFFDPYFCREGSLLTALLFPRVCPPPSPPLFPLLCLFLGKLSKQSGAVREWETTKAGCPPPPTPSPPRRTGVSSERSWAPLWHTDSFTWCETLHAALRHNSFYHNKNKPPSRFCLSFTRTAANNLSLTNFFVLFSFCNNLFVLLNRLMR